MCKLSPMEEKVLVNLINSTSEVVAGKLGIDIKTVNTYKARIRRKRAEAKALLAKTNRYKSVLYRKRKGE